MQSTYNIPRFLSTVNVSEHFTEFTPLYRFSAFEALHNIRTDTGFELGFGFLIPPATRFQEKTETRQRIVNTFAIFNFRPGAVSERVVRG